MDKELINKYKLLALEKLSKSPNGHEAWWPEIVENIGLPENFSDNLKSILEHQGFIFTSTRTSSGDCVRTTPKIVTFLFDLEEKPVSQSRIVTTGHGNIITTGNNNSIQFTGVIMGDINSLSQYLQNNDVEKKEINELIDAIAKDSLTEKKPKIGPVVKDWVKKMFGKAVEGTWKVSIAAAGKILGDAIGAYYGWK